MLTDINITIQRNDSENPELVTGVHMVAGEPDQCGYRFEGVVDNRDGGFTWELQTNFSDMHEQRRTLEQAVGALLNEFVQYRKPSEESE